MKTSTAIWWIRRDLRLTDNQALTSALRSAEKVVPVFILDDHLLSSPNSSEKRTAFLFSGLRKLDEALRERGSRLIVRHGPAQAELCKLKNEMGAELVLAEEDFSPYARRRDEIVAKELALILEPGLTIHHPSQISKIGGSPSTVYTPFMRAWKSLPDPRLRDALPAPQQLPAVKEVASLQLPEAQNSAGLLPFPAGEEFAQNRLREFVDSDAPPIYRHQELRNRPDLQQTSGLSPYLRFGMLSIRQAVIAARVSMQEARELQSEQSAETWLNELIWREFYISILYHFPYVLQQSFRMNLRGIIWSNNRHDFSSWQNGQTGYPLVDAGMRQLQQTGWLHNRLRMVVASFLVKNLLVDWRWGEKWFMHHLIDGDPASNNGGWQWTAGTGTDAAPYFRVFNPVLQSKKFDPQGHYIRQWLPELALVNDANIHEPWVMTPDEQRKSGIRIGVQYPAPIVDLGWSRQRALAAFSRANGRSENTQQAGYELA
jgi:deoxyribodipyrimidine photo-lyase